MTPKPAGAILRLEGIHSTIVSRIESILTDGFRVSSEGRRGAAVYFWYRDGYALRVSYVWYLAALKMGAYKDEPDTRCAVVEAIIDCDEQNYLDLESLEVREAISRVAIAQGLSKAEASDNKRLTKLYEVFIAQLEESSSRRFLVLKASLPVPGLGEEKWYPFSAIGNPMAIMVRDTKVITLRGARRYEGEDDGSGVSPYSEASCG